MPYFSTLSHKRHDFRNQGIKTSTVCLIFSTNFFSETFVILGRIQGDINVRTSIYQPTNAHIISHKTLLKHFKTLRHVSILSDHHQGALFLAKTILQYSQFNSNLQTRCCGSLSCCVGTCCGAVARCASYASHTHNTSFGNTNWIVNSVI